MLVVGCWRMTAAPDHNGTRPVASSVTVWACTAERWAQVAKLDIEAGGKGAGSEVRDVDWAPSMVNFPTCFFVDFVSRGPADG